MNYFKKIFNILCFKSKKRAIILFFMTFMMAFLDTVGIISIFPFVTILANQELIQTNFYLNYIYQFFNFGNPNFFLFIIGLASFFFLISSLIFKSLTTYLQSRFFFMQEYEIGKRLLEKYLNQPYTWFLDRNSSDLGRTILSEVASVVNGALIPAMTLISQSLVILLMLVFMIIIDPKVTIILGTVIVIFYFLIFSLFNKFILRIGKEKIHANKNRFLVLGKIFGSIKEIKLGKSAMSFEYQFSKYARPYALYQSYLQSIAGLPRLVLEALGFGGLILLILYFIKSEKNFDTIVPVILLYVIAGYRLLPAFQNIYSGFTKLRFAKEAVDTLSYDLTNISYKIAKKNKIKKLKFKKQIELQNISFSYPGSSKFSIKDISMNININSKIGIVGETGSGKTTIIETILFLLKPTSGAIFMDGEKITSKNFQGWQKLIGYVPQDIYIADDTISANIAFGIQSNSIDKLALERAAKIANIHEFIIKELEHGYETTLGERGLKISGGQRQRIGIARALYNSPSILILDEATSALDGITEQSVMNEVSNSIEKITVIHVAHRLTTVRHCEQIYVLSNGKIKAQGSYDELKSNSKIFQKMLNASNTKKNKLK